MEHAICYPSGTQNVRSVVDVWKVCVPLIKKGSSTEHNGCFELSLTSVSACVIFYLFGENV